MKMFSVRYVSEGAWVTGPVVTQDRVGPFIAELADRGVAACQVDYVGLAEAEQPADPVT